MRYDGVKTLSNKKGFSLIEMLFAIIIIFVGLGSVYAVLFKGMNHMKIVSGKTYAVVAVTSELEIVKALDGDEFPDAYNGPFLGQVDLSALPNAEGNLRIEDRGNSGGRLKKVTATVTWLAAGKEKTISLSTIVSGP
jgi:prepilin-type N-terminal cleavage/methylation domain-containing protein